MKKILITGGAGFIGSHLSRRLLNEGNYIICLDNLQTGKKKNIQKLLDNPNFHFVEKDVVESFFYELDEIYNLACPASPPHYQDNPIKTLKTSVIGAINLLELAKINNAKILQASTSEVYGDPIVHPQPETYWGNVNPIGPRSCYDEGKRCAETLFNDYANVFNLKTKIIRIFNTYGPNMCVDDGRVVSNFIIQALKNNDITIYGDGLQTRSFQFVDDLVEGIIRMMNSSNDFRGPVNLGNPFEFTMLDLAKKIIKMTNSNSKLIFLDLPQDDPKMRKPLIDLAYNNLNKWKPKIQLDEGLLSTIEYFKNEIA